VYAIDRFDRAVQWLAEGYVPCQLSPWSK